MKPVITFVDEDTTGGILHTLEAEATGSALTLRDLIALRVEEEVRRYNSEEPSSPYSFAVSEAERQLNAKGRRSRLRPEDAEKQTYVALDAFLKNRYFVIVNDGQVDDLDHPIELGERTTVSFLRLTPLVGG